MRPVSTHSHPVCVAVLTWAVVVACLAGCSRAKYRTQADQEAYHVIAERNADPRWQVADYNVDVDPRSRYFDAYDPDHAPMPPDDPSSHQYMQAVDGIDGWPHWHDHGDRMELENPAWRDALAEYVQVGERGEVKLDVDAALKLAYIHSPSHQSQLETLYLSALDVTAERFRLDTQFFGASDTSYAHSGGLAPAGISRSLVGFPADPVTRPLGFPAGPRPESSTLTTETEFLLRRRFATAGELLAGFANSFVFEFTGGDANLSASLANFSFVQPLLRGAGKDVALEQLTLDERNLLANLRAYGQFRQGFYTQVAIGELGVTGAQRFGGGTNLQSFSGQGGVNGYLGLLQQLQQIRNTDDNLSLQLRTRDRLEALLESDWIDLVQVDQFRQSVETERANLLLRQNALELALDRYKTSTLGLPPDLEIELDDSLIRQFQLVPAEATAIQDAIVQLQQQVGELPDIPDVSVLDGVLTEALPLIEPVEKLFDGVAQDLVRMEAAVANRERSMTAQDRARFQSDREALMARFADLGREFDALTVELNGLSAGLTEATRRETSRQFISWVAKFLRLVERMVLVPARARLEAITVDAIDLKPSDAFQVALANRLDFMNGRAALVDRWRLIQVNADALQSILNITSSGDLRTARNNGVSFRAPTGSVRLGLEFDAPFTRLLERNAYRESLIEYQRSRRRFIQSRDSLHLGLRALLRQLEQLRQNLEIQRRAVTIAIRRVDQTQLSLNPPRPAPQPGQRPPINPTTAINLLSAQTSLRDTQNNFLNAWLSYYAARMRLHRELGIMMLDHDGSWIDQPISGSEEVRPATDDSPESELVPPPPMIPAGWIEVANFLEEVSPAQNQSQVVPAAHFGPVGGAPMNRLPPTR